MSEGWDCETVETELSDMIIDRRDTRHKAIKHILDKMPSFEDALKAECSLTWWRMLERLAKIAENRSE